MLFLLTKGAKAPVQVEVTSAFRLPADAVWLDLLNPTRDEELALEGQLNLLLPTREEMAEIETSSRLYRENHALFMTAQLVSNSTGEAPVIGPVTFVLVGERLVTIRYMQPTAFKIFLDHVAHEPDEHLTGASIFVGLLDEIIDRLADIFERAVAETEELSARIFSQQGKIDFRREMRHLGRIQQVNAKIRESAGSLTRLMIFAQASDQIEQHAQCADHILTLQRDLASVVDHTGYLSGNITFLLDAAMGMINVEQNAIIKIFSIFGVIFLPPTLIASYFGMNFKHMPIFDWAGGEFFAAALMLVTVLFALWWFKRRGWF